LERIRSRTPVPLQTEESRERPYSWSGEGREHSRLCRRKRAENARILGAEKAENTHAFTDGRELRMPVFSKRRRPRTPMPLQTCPYRRKRAENTRALGIKRMSKSQPKTPVLLLGRNESGLYGFEPGRFILRRPASEWPRVAAFGSGLR